MKLYTVAGRRFEGEAIFLDHPMSFQTLAVDSKLKKAIMVDVEKFIKLKKTTTEEMGKWKIGYLLPGPLGTGQSSLISAMANHLKYDIHDHLKLMLLAMPCSLVLLMEDILRSQQGKWPWVPHKIWCNDGDVWFRRKQKLNNHLVSVIFKSSIGYKDVICIVSSINIFFFQFEARLIRGFKNAPNVEHLVSTKNHHFGK